MDKKTTEYVMRKPVNKDEYSITIPKPLPLKNEMRFCFPDGTFATFNDAGSLQEFLDKMTRYHELEKDLEIARKALEDMEHWLGVVRRSMISHLNNQNNTLLEHYETDPTVQNIDKAKSVLKHHIKQIEQKE